MDCGECIWKFLLTSSSLSSTKSPEAVVAVESGNAALDAPPSETTVLASVRAVHHHTLLKKRFSDLSHLNILLKK